MSEILKLSNLSKSYGDLQVLKGIDLNVKNGEVVVILGPSGCGKSTTLRCINGLEPFDGGQIEIAGEKIDRDYKDWIKIRQKVGMVFQNYELFDHMNVIENIVLGPVKAQKRSREEVEKEAEAWLEKVGLKHKKYAYPKELSGGQKQRIAIVRALCMRPEIMLFDEITGLAGSRDRARGARRRHKPRQRGHDDADRDSRDGLCSLGGESYHLYG